MPSRSFRDPIHGFIPVNKAECQLLDTAPFQRLRFIRQLALTNLVYHGAEHTRFGHSLGVMHQASETLKSVNEGKNLGWSDEDFNRRMQLLRLASLCHDVGHSPFSHAGEEGGLMPQNHEDYSVAIITAQTGRASEIRQVIEENEDAFYGITPEEVADVISGQTLGQIPFLTEIMSGDLDSDRTDYLQRDSLYCGVRYGRFDNERLIKTLTWTEEVTGGNPVLAIDEDGVHAAEGLLLARYFMFTQVYFHRVRRAYDYHLSQALGGILQQGNYPDSDHLDEYLEWDDLRVLGALREIAGDNSVAGNHAARILRRDHYRVAYSTNEHPSSAQLSRWNQLCTRVEERFDDDVAFDTADKLPHELSSLRDFPVVKEPGDAPTFLEEESALINRLEEIRVRRILAPKGLKSDVREFCRQQNLNVN
ncbi:MAG: HD domain-containing protein [Chloroflexi bacterium]|nr:HD domain-containing protein [Chloroflexota bacterium]